MGRGDKEAADQAAVDALRDALRFVDMDGVVVIGEGEKDEAPMLYIGERVGTGRPPKVDVAVDPIDGADLTAKGLPNAITVVALAERGAMYYDPHIMYMQKIAVGPAAKGAIDINAPVKDNLVRIARFMERNVKTSPWSCSIVPDMRDSSAIFARPALGSSSSPTAMWPVPSWLPCPAIPAWTSSWALAALGGRARYLRAQVLARRYAVQVVASFGGGETDGAKDAGNRTLTGS